MTDQTTKDARAFVERCAPMFGRLSTIARGITSSNSDSDDIVQQAIVIGIQKQQTFDSDEDFFYWMAAIVRNCALNHYRKRNRRRTAPTDPVVLTSVQDQSTSRSPVDQSTGQLHSMQSAFDDRVKHALETLTEQARSCLLLRTVEQMNYQEISKVVGVTESAAVNLVHRSKNRLREILGSGLEGGERGQ